MSSMSLIMEDLSQFSDTILPYYLIVLFMFLPINTLFTMVS